MDFEPWMLLVFPLFFGMGWLAARIDIKELLSESSALPRSYFQGLNFLLNEQQDQAIEAFIEVVKVDPQTVSCTRAGQPVPPPASGQGHTHAPQPGLRADLAEEKKQQACSNWRRTT
jgi:hypothetical protein